MGLPILPSGNQLSDKGASVFPQKTPVCKLLDFILQLSTHTLSTEKAACHGEGLLTTLASALYWLP